MSAPLLRTRAARYEARADRLEKIGAMFAGRAAHLCKTDVSAAIALQDKANRAAKAEDVCLFKAFGCKLAAARIEQHQDRARALADIAKVAA